MTPGPRGFGFAGQTALVTGAASGIGRGTALALAELGAFVLATDIDEAGLTSLQAAAKPHGSALSCAVLDVTDEAAVERAVEQLEAARPIDGLVNAAGVCRVVSVQDADSHLWQRLSDVNTGGVMRCSRAVARRMMARRRGSIVTVSSNAGRVPRKNMAAYAASKAAASMFTKCLGLELAEYGIRCNVVAPGSTDTPMQRGLWGAEDGTARLIAGVPGDYRVGIPTGRIASVQDVVASTLFLLSELARQITLHELVVDGGASLGM